MKKKMVLLLLCYTTSLTIMGCGKSVDELSVNESEIGTETPTPIISPTSDLDITPILTETELPDDKSSSTFSDEVNESSSEKVYEYDDLENVFIRINSDSSIEDLESLINEYSLFYTVEEYNKSTSGKCITYKLAYSEGAALQKYSDPGDYLEISFDEGNDNTLMFSHYVDSSKFGCSALLYNYGVWYDFREKSPSQYSGYYTINPNLGKNGIVIKYSNGNEVATNYFIRSSAEDALNK